MVEVRTRRRNEGLREAINQAVLAELDDHGYAGVTFEGVARRARTSKPVLYRRYRSRAQMVLDAVRQSAVHELTWKPTGSLRGDLNALLGAVSDQFARFGVETYLSLLAESDDELLDDARAAAGVVTRETMAVVFQSARQRGELGPEPIPDQVASVPISLIRHDGLFFRRVDANAIASTIDRVIIPLLETVSRKPSERSRTKPGSAATPDRTSARS